jgi:hypothetical protein
MPAQLARPYRHVRHGQAGRILRRTGEVNVGKFQAEEQDAVEGAVQGGQVQVAGQYGVQAVGFDTEICERFTADLSQMTGDSNPVAVHAHVASARRPMTGAGSGNLARTVLRVLL